jgi:hypothetical protein
MAVIGQNSNVKLKKGLFNILSTILSIHFVYQSNFRLSVFTSAKRPTKQKAREEKKERGGVSRFVTTVTKKENERSFG